MYSTNIHIIKANFIALVVKSVRMLGWLLVICIWYYSCNMILTVKIFGVSLIIVQFTKITSQNLVFKDQLPKSGVGGFGMRVFCPKLHPVDFPKVEVKGFIWF